MKQNQKNAVYHVLGATVGIVPIIGVAAPALYFAFRKFPPMVEENHYRAVMNFLITFFLIGLGIYGVVPRSIAIVIWLIWTLMTTLILLYNGFYALKGESPSYPFSIQFMKPLQRTRSPEEMMWPDDQ